MIYQKGAQFNQCDDEFVKLGQGTRSREEQLELQDQKAPLRSGLKTKIWGSTTWM